MEKAIDQPLSGESADGHLAVEHPLGRATTERLAGRLPTGGIRLGLEIDQDPQRPRRERGRTRDEEARETLANRTKYTHVFTPYRSFTA